MKIGAQIVADSLSPQRERLTSVLATFPKYLLAEAKTHRIVSQDSNEVEIVLDVSLNADKNLSRNSASSRAIPFNRLIKSVRENPFIPIAWMKDHKGMQGTEYFTDSNDIQTLVNNHLYARDAAVSIAETQAKLGVTKQICNRYLEYFMYTTVLITATEWGNFFELRCPQYSITGDDSGGYFRSRKQAIKMSSGYKRLSDLDWMKMNKGQAEIHMMALAEAIWDAMNESKPRQLEAGEWHIPFENKIDLLSEAVIWQATNEQYQLAKVKISTAMAARTSYTVVGDEKQVSYETLLGIHDKMAIAKPFHASPFEHCARAMSNEEYGRFVRGETKWIKYSEDCNTEPTLDLQIPDGSAGWCRNYKGFIQYRHILENEYNR